MLICYEGLDGVGKSEVSKSVAKNIGFKFVEKPTKVLLSLNETKDIELMKKIHYDYSKKVQATYYLMGYISVLEDSRKENIILDRGVLSTYYFSHHETTNNIFDFYVNNYGSPDLTIVLYASIEERIKRISKRNPSDIDLSKKRIYSDDYAKYKEGINKYEMNHIVIGTDLMNKDQVVEICTRVTKMFIENPQKVYSLQNFLNINNIDELNKISYQEMLFILDKEELNNELTYYPSNKSLVKTYII